MGKIKKLQAMSVAAAVTMSTIFGNIPVQAAALNTTVMVGAEKSASELSKPIVKETEEGKLVTWDCIWFGNYYQSDAEGKVKDPIKWRVLSVEGNDAFLVADKALEQMPYCEGTVLDPEPNEWGYIDKKIETDTLYWENCTLRSFLNGYGAEENVTKKDYTEDNFIDAAFSQEEQAAIMTSQVTPDENTDKHSPQGNTTEDKLYLLSALESLDVELGFVDNNARRYYDTPNYTFAGGRSGESGKVGVSQEMGYSWWTRTSGQEYSGSYIYPVSVDLYGGVELQGGYADSSGFGVRPAMHLDLSKAEGLWKYAGTVNSDGTKAEENGMQPVVTTAPTKAPTVTSEPEATETPQVTPTSEPEATEIPQVTPTSEPEATETPQVTIIVTAAPSEKPAESEIIIHFKSPWENAKVYFWQEQQTEEAFSKWPGVDMEKEDGDWYVYTVSNAQMLNLVFNDGQDNKIETAIVEGEWWYADGWYDYRPKNEEVVISATPQLTETPEKEPTMTPRAPTPSQEPAITPSEEPLPTVTAKPEMTATPTPQATETPSNPPASADVQKKDISKNEIALSAYTYKYNGKVQHPTVTVKGLKENVDYYVRYEGGCKEPGTYRVTITGTGAYTGVVQKDFKITITKNSCYTVGKYSYKVLSVNGKGGTAAIIGTKDNKKSATSVKVADTVKIGGVSFAITEISAKAFANNKKLTSVVIGSNVKKISNKAFYGDAKLKKITIKSKKLSKVEKNAWKNINAKAVFKVPSSKYKAYKKMMNSKTGVKSTMKIKK